MCNLSPGKNRSRMHQVMCIGVDVCFEILIFKLFMCIVIEFGEEGE